MSHDTQNNTSLAVSVPGVEPSSDDGSTVSVGGDKSGMVRGFADGLFDLGDGDLHLTINGATLETHKFLIKRFAGLKPRINNDTITLEFGEPGLETFRDALKILYASVIQGPFNFDHTTLISALLLATKYDFPALRIFAISKLENAKLNAVERIRLAREFDIPSWEEPAYLEICERDEPLTMPEAGVLGLEAVLYVGVVRERELRRRLKDAEVIIEVGKGKGRAADEPATTATGEGELTQTAPSPGPDEKPAPELEPILASVTEVEVEAAVEVEVEAEAEITSEVGPVVEAQANLAPENKLSVNELTAYCSNLTSINPKIEVPVSDCDCKLVDKYRLESTCKCKLPPCAMTAFKELQTQQLAYKSNISALETTIEQMQITLSSFKFIAELTETTPPPPPTSSSLQGDVKRWLVSPRDGVKTT
ncbi:hypothetical protein BDV93DRAFT_588022 [Ceratobasidium sp. AG-I]|nr:hypothetical protein BDV93DRAFT_588022 [Ceratobasidium sp. AG-I]